MGRPRRPQALLRPGQRGAAPPLGGARRGASRAGLRLTEPDTFDGSMGARTAHRTTRPDRTAAAPRRDGGSTHPEVLPPLDIQVDEAEGRVLVRDRGETFGYELWFRSRRGDLGGPGWMELAFDLETGEPIQTAVPTCEVMAVARETGCHERVAGLTESLAAWFEAPGHPAADRIARRLRAEVRTGQERERLSVRPVQARLLERMVAGESVSIMCERGGFVDAHGRGDTSWLMRRAGLTRVRCSRTGKVRVARTASYQVFCQLVAAADASPHEFEV